ncbi:MAG: sigma-70 family RNA polymerase sigma factor [bacterium]|nr:sigma-70 family RNA polymerase sigma factor [bacterium]
MTSSNIAVLDKRNTYFSEQFKEYRAIINGAIYTKIGNTETTQDLTQEVFLAFLLHISNEEKNDTIENVRQWLLATTRNKLYDYFQDVKKMPKDVAMDEASGAVELTFINGFKDARIIITEALDENISDDLDLTIFDLIAVHNYSYRDAGREIGMSKTGVQYRYDKIVKTILDYLKKEKNIDELGDLL